MKLYIDTFKKENIVYKLLTLGIIAVILLFMSKTIINTVYGYGYPKEILEPASVNFTRTLIEGNNPYVRANIVKPGNEPPVNYEYPFLNNIFAAAFAALFSNDVLAGHYIVSFLAMLGTAFIGASIILRYSRTTVGPTLGFLMLLFCHWRYGYISACPDGFGLFVTMMTVSAILSPSVKKRSLWCAVGTVAAFYSKQYFAGICISIFIFMLLYSYREALKYFGWCLTLFIISVLIINAVWPLYWDYSLLVLMQGNLNGISIAGILYVLEQLKYLAVVFIGLLVVVAVAAVKSFSKKKTKDSLEAALETNNDEKGLNKRSVLSQIGVCEADAVWFLIIQIPVQIVVLFFFGRNNGAYLTYFLQLLIPSVVMLALILMERMDTGRYELIYMGSYGLLIAVSVVFGMGKLPMHMLTTQEKNNWEKAYAILDEYREKGDIYHYQATAYNGAYNGDSLYNTGHDGEMNAHGYEMWRSSELKQLLFPDAGAIFEENIVYREVMKDKIVNHEVAMITIPNGGVLYITEEELADAGYTEVESIPLQLGNTVQEVKFWAAE